jgi:hypothetical protein
MDKEESSWKGGEKHLKIYYRASELFWACLLSPELLFCRRSLSM